MLHHPILRSVFFMAMILGAFALPAQAQNVERIGDFQDWSAYTTKEAGALVCFAASVPVKSVGKYTRRGEIYSVVTLRPAQNRPAEVSFIIGYTFKSNSELKVSIDEKSYVMLTKDDTAWLPNDPNLDAEMVAAMKSGLSMVARGTSSRGTLTTDNYSLRGFTKAYEAISKACQS
jgi:hypothetical protein